MVLIVALLSLPYSSYYMSMPKPEPVQLLFLTLFFYFYKKNNYEFGKYWLLLGLAFGTKISTLPAIFVILAATFFTHKIYNFDTLIEQKSIDGFLFFLLGLGLAVPILFLPILLIILSFNFLLWIFKRNHVETKFQFLSLAVSLLIPVILYWPYFKTWLLATFFNTKHGLDNQNINFLSWVNYFFDVWMIAPPTIGIFFIYLVSILIILSIISSYGQKKLIGSFGFILMLAGLSLNFSIFINVHRLWGFYLFPGSVLFLAGLLSIIDFYINNRKPFQGLLLLAASRLLSTGIALVLFFISLFYWLPDGMNFLKIQSNRTIQKDFKLENDSYNQIIKTLKEISSNSNVVFNVAYDPILFPPDNNRSYLITEFWGPYINWNSNIDIIIFSKVHTPAERRCVDGSPNYSACILESLNYSKYVINKNEKCNHYKCYERYSILPNGGEILLLRHAN